MKRFVRDVHGRFTETRRDPRLDEISGHFFTAPAAPEPQRFLTEDECRARIEQMKRSGTLPSFEQFHRVVEDVLDEVDERRGNEPRERSFPRKVKKRLQ